MEGSSSNSNTSNDPTQYVPFHTFLQQFQSTNGVNGAGVASNGVGGGESSNLVPTAPEFVPRERKDAAQPTDRGAIPKTRNGYNNFNHYNRRGGGGGTGNGNYRGGRGDNHRRNFNYHRNNHNDHHQHQGASNSHNHHHQQQHQPEENESPEIPPSVEMNSKKTFEPRRNNWNSNQRGRGNYRNSHNNNNGRPPRPHPPPIAKESKCQREKLLREITSNTLECLVCCEKIKDFHPIWSCSTCYHCFHLKCLKKWAESSKSDAGDWRCPACQTPKTQIPHDYFCFCGKTRNPAVNRMETPHSCGEVCGTTCENGHPCTILCHPGPHPTCQALHTRSCPCGKTQKTLQCSQKDDIKCTETCAKLLSCGLHQCQELCHADECKPCKEVVEISCHCEKQHKTVACDITNEAYSCTLECEKLLKCGNHKCTNVCHAGECKPCELLPEFITSCPCSKQQVLPGERKSCLDDIPLCGKICKKHLKCGQPSQPHQCMAKCHLGKCPPCNSKTMVKCRCGKSDGFEVKCKQLTTRADDARCKKKCNKMKSCLRHKCQEFCCIDIDHICKQTCNKTLSCGKHKCTLPCHRGNCLTCERVSFDELYCECGAAVIYPPIPCGTKRPTCTKPCSRTHACDHDVLHPCHTDPKCPPCVVFTTKSCYGNHEQRKTIPCNEESFSCGRLCNKPILGCDHKCNKICHAGECLEVDEVCRQKCQIIRSDCVHACNQPCHALKDPKQCPDTNCRESVEVQCACGNLKKTRACFDFNSEYRRFANAQLANTMQEMQNGNVINLNDIMGNTNKTNKTNKVLECNDECRLIERNKRLEMALGPIDPTKVAMPTYSDFLKNFARKDPQLIKNVHDKLTDLVKLAKESKQKSRSYSFPVMNRDKRQMVHEMCEAFAVSSVAYDAEPNRNVVATAHRDTCFCPTMSVFEVIQREAGQRVRLPIPQNAWKTPK